MSGAHRRVWITGASSGLGEALAHEYADQGDEVCLSARSQDALERVNHALSHPGRVFPCDVTDDAALVRTIDSIEKDSGPIDIAILNAGTYQKSPVVALRVDDARQLFELNFFSIVRTIELLVSHFKSRRRGHIVVISSVAGDIGLPYAGFYSASKSALNRLCEALHPELAELGISISVVHPGFIKTPLTDQNDFPMPFIVEAKEGASAIRRGVDKKRFEIRFPLAMSLAMRFLSRLPRSLALRLTKRMLRDDVAA